MNQGKSILECDLKKDQDREKIIELYRKMDIIIDCFRPNVLEKLKLGPKEAFIQN